MPFFLYLLSNAVEEGSHKGQEVACTKALFHRVETGRNEKKKKEIERKGINFLCLDKNKKMR